jgi:hypothetical protein
MSKAKAPQLTEKEQRFVTAFMGPARGNITRAAQMAGYGRTKGSASVSGFKLLKKAKIAQAIQNVRKQQEQGTRHAILDAEARDRILSAIASSPAADHHARIRAIAELNKCGGRHSIKHVIEGTVTLEQILAESRGAPPPLKLVGSGKTEP